MKIYIASSLSNMAEVRRLRDELILLGHEITYDWTEHGPAPDRLPEICEKEMVGVTYADLVFVILPGGKGTHVELGLALGWDIPIVLVSNTEEAINPHPDSCAFYWNPLVAHVDKRDFAHFMMDFAHTPDLWSQGEYEDIGTERDWTRHTYTKPTRPVKDNDLVLQLDEYRAHIDPHDHHISTKGQDTY